jgi:hypothetical protein
MQESLNSQFSTEFARKEKKALWRSEGSYLPMQTHYRSRGRCLLLNKTLNVRAGFDSAGIIIRELKFLMAIHVPGAHAQY